MNEAEIWKGFEAALAGHPFQTVDDLRAEIEDGRASVFHGPNSAVFVRWDFESGTAECAPQTGDVGEVIAHLRPLIEDACAKLGIGEIHIQAGRQAWARLMRPYGYEEAAVILRKKLGHGFKQ